MHVNGDAATAGNLTKITVWWLAPPTNVYYIKDYVLHVDTLCDIWF